MLKTKLRKEDIVVVNTGVEKGEKGKILMLDLKKGTALVEGINVRTIHAKAKKQGQESGILKRERPVNVSKLNYYCDRCDKGVRLGIKIEDDGTKKRVCKKCGEII